jgi:hypothetical protein
MRLVIEWRGGREGRRSSVGGVIVGPRWRVVWRGQSNGGGAKGDTSWPLRGTLRYTRRGKEMRCADLIRESLKKIAYTQQAESPQILIQHLHDTSRRTKLEFGKFSE